MNAYDKMILCYEQSIMHSMFMFTIMHIIVDMGFIEIFPFACG